MSVLTIVRYHKNLSEKAFARWEHVELLLDSSRELRQAYERILQINRDYAFSLDAFVDSENTKWIRKFNEFFIELEYGRALPNAIKKFSNVLETITCV